MSLTTRPSRDASDGLVFFTALTRNLCQAYKHGLHFEVFKNNPETPTDWSRNLSWTCRIWRLAKRFEVNVSRTNTDAIPSCWRSSIDRVANDLGNACRALGLADPAQQRLSWSEHWIEKADHELCQIQSQLENTNACAIRGLSRAQEMIPTDMEALQSSRDLNYKFLKGRVTHAIESEQIEKRWIQELVCMDLRLLFFLSLLDLSFSAKSTEESSVFQSSHRLHHDTLGTISNVQLGHSIERRWMVGKNMIAGMSLSEALHCLDESPALAFSV